MDASFDVVLDAVPCCFSPTLTERKILSSQLKKLAIPLRTKKAKHKAQGTKQLGVLLLSPGWDAGPSQTPSIFLLEISTFLARLIFFFNLTSNVHPHVTEHGLTNPSIIRN